MRIKFLLTTYILWQTMVCAQTRYWQATDGLATNEVHQIIPLPNRQMLVNCEGVFCISDGVGFIPVAYKQPKSFRLKHYSQDGYAHFWQGDSLLWLRDFYYIYLFDARSRSFRHDIQDKLPLPEKFKASPRTVIDWQGGTWSGTLNNGIEYTPPKRNRAETIESDHPLAAMARNSAKFDIPIDKERHLQCQHLNQLEYRLSDGATISINAKLPQLNKYRYIVGACPIQQPWVVLFTQNGACLLNTDIDTLATFSASEIIGEHTDKYNCMLRDKKNHLWVGTQNGLYCLIPSVENVMSPPLFSCKRIEGLSNNCIRSLVADANDNIWAGTSCGISRVTPSIINYGEEDGIPQVAMMEREVCLTDDGFLIFVHHSTAATKFRPEWLTDSVAPTPVLTELLENGHSVPIPSFSSESYKIPHDRNHITFRFSSLNYASPAHFSYRYRLNGLEKDWHFIDGADGSINADYKALTPGEYTFEAQAVASDNLWSNSLLITFAIQPPFYMTWWAKTIYILLIATFIISVLVIYIKRKRISLELENDNKVNQLFERRQEARHLFATHTQIDPKKIGINDEEKKLTTQLLNAIEKHIDDDGYGVDQLAQDVALSRTNLYCKLRNMLGISPADFIRNVRLKRAAQLLTDTSLSINEIASNVGFVTSRNFSSNFKKMFGILPSEYRGTHKAGQCPSNSSPKKIIQQE